MFLRLKSLIPAVIEIKANLSKNLKPLLHNITEKETEPKPCKGYD